MRLVLFAEGTTGPPLDNLWRGALPALLELPPFERVVGFSKHHLVAMSQANMGLKNKTSTVSVGLDALITRELRASPFDCAVVAWDLVPAWDSGSDASACRWEETLLLYEGLSRSSSLPSPWCERAKQRFDGLKNRNTPAQRTLIPRPEAHTVLGVCMEPEFEGMLMHEAGVKAVLGLKGRIRDWPNTWDRQRDPRPSDTLAKAIEAARRVQPRPAVFRKVRLPMREAKHEWGKLFIEKATGGFRKSLLNHPISQRLSLLLAQSKE